jgi:hypothetical protein
MYEHAWKEAPVVHMSGRADILEFQEAQAWEAFGPNPKFTFKCVTCIAPTPDFLLFKHD